ncbi:MAG TPA: glycosyltransferase [Mycobacteriales bacterium]|nr:glycosyltransferase [Mycobacteriales bacterium]
MTLSDAPRVRAANRAVSAPPLVDIVVPVHNEERDLVPSVTRLHEYLRHHVPYTWRITIVDNASTDRTWELATDLAAALTDVVAVTLPAKGRGRALRETWATSDARVVAYMDVDLSTDLAALPPLIAPLLSGHSDVAIGTRLSPGARVVRGPKRELISRCYNLLLHSTLGTSFTDAQCGFKAMRADRARELLPLVEDTGWFFDTELLVLAERRGLRIHEVPVDWVDDPDSRVDIVRTATADLRGVLRMLLRMPAGGERPSRAAQILRFASIGVLSTVAYLLLYLALRPALSAQSANLVALLTTAVANTAANRRWTFAVAGRSGVVRHHLQGLTVFAAAVAVTSASLGLLHLVTPSPARATEVAVLVTANLVATALRYLALRHWIFASGRTA